MTVSLSKNKKKVDIRKPSLHVIPAYGRDYRSRKAVLADLKKNLDFSIRDISCPWDGRVASLQDIEGDYKQIVVRYGKMLRRSAVFELPLSE